MGNINIMRKMSYLQLSVKYYQLLLNKEIEFDCLNQNFETAKEKSYSYYTDDEHDEENLKIYDEEMQALKNCLYNVKECKRLDSLICETKVKLLKAEKKLN